MHQLVRGFNLLTKPPGKYVKLHEFVDVIKDVTLLNDEVIVSFDLE